MRLVLMLLPYVRLCDLETVDISWIVDVVMLNKQSALRVVLLFQWAIGRVTVVSNPIVQ